MDISSVFFFHLFVAFIQTYVFFLLFSVTPSSVT